MPKSHRSSISTPTALHRSTPGIGWVSTRCLQASPHPLDCHRCRDACPAEALEFKEDENGVTLRASDTCHGCAQCVAACPTEALISTEIAQLIDTQPEGEPLRLGCHRVSREPGMQRLHCLRSLESDQLAWLSVRALPDQVTLHLPNACRDCLAGPQDGGDLWFEHAAMLCRVTITSATATYQSPTHALSRRSLLMGRATPQLPLIEAEDGNPKARRLQRHLTAIAVLDDVPAPVLPGLALNRDACQSHGVCARVCPTTALEQTPQGELIFNASECLDCGHCLSACPEGALLTGKAGRTSPVILLQVKQAVCFECGRAFARKDSVTPDDICPACQREKAMMQESFHDLFG